MKIRAYTPESREAISRWYDGGLVPDSYLGDGFIVSQGGADLAVGFLIETKSALCIYEYMQTNPDAPSFLKAKAVKSLTGFMIEEAARRGFKTLIGYTPTANRALLKHYRRMGCVLSPEYTIVSRRLD